MAYQVKCLRFALLAIAAHTISATVSEGGPGTSCQGGQCPEHTDDAPVVNLLQNHFAMQQQTPLTDASTDAKVASCASDASDVTLVASLADGKPCEVLPSDLCDTGEQWGASIVDAIGDHAVCNTKDMQLAQKDGSCLVYGVGIFDDWTFEKNMAELGCEVHAFDPTISRPPWEEPNLPNLHFHQWGLAGKTDLDGEHEVHGSLQDVKEGGKNSTQKKTKAPMMSLVDIMQKLGHAGRKLTLLKVDCEGCEWESLKAIPKDLWHRIGQLSMEFHFSKTLMLDTTEAVHSAAQVALALKEAGFKKWRTGINKGYEWDRNLREDLVEAGMRHDQCCRLVGLYRDTGSPATALDLREETKQ